MSLLYGSEITDEELEWMRRNRLFVMTDGHGAMSLDELNELINLWNKGVVLSPSLDNVCEKSRYILPTRACLFETYKPLTKMKVISLCENDVDSLLKLLSKANVFPADRKLRRTMHSEFFWLLISPRKSVGSEKDQAKERVEIDTAENNLFDILCSVDDSKHYDTYDSDDKEVSNSSSCFGSTGSNENPRVEDEDRLDWDVLDEETRRIQIANSLKRLGNVKRRKISPHILTDYMSSEFHEGLTAMKKNYEDSVRREKMRVNSVFRAVVYFEKKMKTRRELLTESIKRSEGKSYSKPHYSWRERYEQIMKEKHGD